MDYDIKKGWMKNIEGDLLPKMMEEIFGNVECERKRCLVLEDSIVRRVDHADRKFSVVQYSFFRICS